MARFKTILTDSGAILLTQALVKEEKVNINSVVMGNGVFKGDKNKVTEIVSPIKVNTKMGDREFIEGENGQPNLLKISIQTLNDGLTEPVAIREIGLYAEDTLFAYAWIDGEDTDNILPPPLDIKVADTIHMHELALFVTNQENANIEVSFAFDSFVSHRHLNEKLESLEVVKELTKEIGEHIEDKSIHISEEERKGLEEIIAGGSGHDNILINGPAMPQSGTAGTNLTWAPGNGGSRVRRIGNIVELKLALSRAGSGDSLFLNFTLPVGFRPSIARITFPFGFGNPNANANPGDIAHLMIQSSGELSVSIATGTAATGLHVLATYFAV